MKAELVKRKPGFYSHGEQSRTGRRANHDGVSHRRRRASPLPLPALPNLGHISPMFDTAPRPGHQWPSLQPGWVWLCGAGPGDPGLLTIHALNALRQADAVVYDALVQECVLDWAPQAEKVYAGKRGGKPSAQQRDISLRLVDLARAGKRVLRLKGGDPFIFGRGGEEAQTLVQHGVPVRIVPGISAGIGGLACRHPHHAPRRQSVSHIRHRP